MSNTKHTPGPWELGGEYGYPLIYRDQKGESHLVLGEKLNREKPKEYLANARLIAAAPELLEASKLAARHLGDAIQFHGLNGEGLANNLTKLLETIAKAEGR